MKHQEDQARSTRLVDVRKSYLLPISEVTSTWLQESNKLSKAVDRITGLQASGDAQSLVGEQQELTDVMSRVENLRAEFNVLRGRISDLTPEELISAVELQQRTISPILLEAAKVANIQTEPFDVEAHRALLERVDDAEESLRPRLIAVNQRIEELLVG